MNTATDDVGKSEASDKELLQAQAHIWNHTFSFINSMSLKCAVQLGIPDIIHNHGKPMTLSQLMDALKLDHAKAPCMRRLLRMLIHSGFFVNTNIAGIDDEKEEDNYSLTPASKLLLKDHPASVRPFLLGMLDPIKTAPWHCLGDWFRSSDPNPFVTTHGRYIWDMARQEPRLNQFFNDAMASDARLVSGFIIGNYKQVFEGLNSLVDVGGGDGTMGKAIADAFPEMKCTVLDLPYVVQGLKGTKNLSYVGGDMFQSIPPSDALLLKWVLHDWSDEECVKILKKCKEAIPSKENGGKVMIIEMVLGDADSNTGYDSKAIETQLFFDMQMLVMANGRERREKDWAKLFFQADFCGYKIIPLLGLRCSEEQMGKYGIHLLALSHVYLVPQLKQICTRGLVGRLTTENVVDVLQLARLCDAPGRKGKVFSAKAISSLSLPKRKREDEPRIYLSACSSWY